ncbi:hypothetical protein PLACP1_32960 [Planifilum fimeticola]
MSDFLNNRLKTPLCYCAVPARQPWEKSSDPRRKQDLRKPEKWIELPGKAEKFFL